MREIQRFQEAIEALHRRSIQIQLLADHTSILRVVTAESIMSILVEDFQKMKRKNKYIGVIEVCELDDNQVLEGAKGAFVNVIVLAKDENEYKSIAIKELDSLGLKVINIENIESVDKKITNSELIFELEQASTKVNESFPVFFDEFQVYFDE